MEEQQPVRTVIRIRKNIPRRRAAVLSSRRLRQLLRVHTAPARVPRLKVLRRIVVAIRAAHRATAVIRPAAPTVLRAHRPITAAVHAPTAAQAQATAAITAAVPSAATTVVAVTAEVRAGVMVAVEEAVAEAAAEVVIADKIIETVS